MLQVIIQIINEYCEKNDIFYDEPLSPQTSLIADLGLTSVDFVSIFQKCQGLNNERLSFIELVMPIEGQYIADLSIGELSDFLESKHTSATAESKAIDDQAGRSLAKIDDTKYRRSSFSQHDFDEFKSLIQRPAFSEVTPIHTDYELVFILSSPRSGSTLLQRMLDRHPDIESPEELHLLHYDTYAQRYTALSEPETRHLLGGTARLRAKIKGITLDDSQEIEMDYMQRGVPVADFFAEIGESFICKYLVDKTPSYAYSHKTLERITVQFPSARFIYLVRHPSAVMKSLIDSQLHEIIPFAKRYSGNASAIPEMIWALCNENIQSALSSVNPSQLHFVGYERLVTSPQETIASVLSFLQLPFHADCADPYGEVQNEQIETNEYAGDLKFFLENKIVTARADIWKSFPSLHTLSNITDSLMNRTPMLQSER